MDESQAITERSRGKHIMTLNKKLAQNLVGRFKGLTETATRGQLIVCISVAKQPETTSSPSIASLSV